MNPYPSPGDVGEILVSAEQIQQRVSELGQQIAADCAGSAPLLVGILKGSVLFTADLMRAIDGPVEIDFMAVSSYGNATESSGVVRIVKDLDESIAGRDVILVEDIIDSGLTMAFLLEHLAAQGPASVKTCSLLVREGQQAPDVQLDYVGFRIPPAFVIGYGLDVAQRYRNLPYIASYTGR
ncbi:MAG: hypoxanthine phosphoribosyltransferase [Acidimicrobiales bacterium]|jgi:hypoxanthine phosphoribosyltransferase